jgi:hypothetical protein
VNRQLEHEIDLGSFNPMERKRALHELHRLLVSGEVAPAPELPLVNLHCHTFFSFNAYFYSPSGFAWEAKKRGLYAAGIIDFDVLDGVEEFIEACSFLGLRSITGIESRVFIDDWKDREINSPKEPGIYYAMGYGFTDLSNADSFAAKTLKKMGALARQRNELMLEKLNRHLMELQVSYEQEVLPLTPSGNATERHMLVAIEEKSRKVFPQQEQRIRFWADSMNVDEGEIRKLIERPVDLQMLIRSKLMKFGGPGYCTPDRENFPPLEEVFSMVRGFGAVPTAGWLDGTSRGEEDAEEFLDFLVHKGASCLAIIPDRNWNIRDTEERKVKVKNLNEIIESARKRKLPILVGTEMNKNGQKFVDDFFADALQPFQNDFLKGARIMNGHTLLRDVLDIGLLSEEIQERFADDLDTRNRFFEEVGKLVPSDNPFERSDLERTIRKLWELT